VIVVARWKENTSSLLAGRSGSFRRGSALLQEALTKAVEKDVEGTPARVFTAEHLAAIALETGRAKDKARVLQFIEADAIDLDQVQEILTRHGLAGAWEQFERQFLK